MSYFIYHDIAEILLKVALNTINQPNHISNSVLLSSFIGLLSLDFWKSTGQSVIWITVSSVVLVGTITFIIKLRCHCNTHLRQNIENQEQVVTSHTTSNYEGNRYLECIEIRGKQIDTQDNTLTHYEGLQYSGDNTEMSHYLTITHGDSAHTESVDNLCNGYESLQREISDIHHVYSGIKTDVR